MAERKSYRLNKLLHLISEELLSDEMIVYVVSVDGVTVDKMACC